MSHRRPHRVNVELTNKLREMYQLFPVLSPATPKGVTIYAVNQRCGRAYYGKRMITVPTWAMTRGKGPGFDLYYLAHELAHVLDFDSMTYNRRAPHGPSFMAHFKRLCPVEFQHFEIGYKPRRAAAAGITRELAK